VVLINTRVNFSRARKILAFKYIYSDSDSPSILFEHASDIFVLGIFCSLAAWTQRTTEIPSTERESEREREGERTLSTPNGDTTTVQKQTNKQKKKFELFPHKRRDTQEKEEE
jgi:hypothetical protein